MAYVKLPEELRTVRVRKPDGAPATLIFSVFAGEVSLATTPAGHERHSEDLRAAPDPARKPGRRGERGYDSAHRLWIRSPRSEQGFEFQRLPIEFDPGQVAAVAAVMTPTRKDGPIVAAANIDKNEKVDFVGREQHLLRLLGGYSRDYRGWAPMLWGWLGAATWGVVIGAASFAGLNAAWAGDGGWSSASAFSNALVAGEPMAAGPAAISMAIAVSAALYGGVRSSLRVASRARFQRRLLKTVWGSATDALAFVQDHADAFRVSRASSQAVRAAAERAAEGMGGDRNGRAAAARQFPRNRGMAPLPAFLSERH